MKKQNRGRVGATRFPIEDRKSIDLDGTIICRLGSTGRLSGRRSLAASVDSPVEFYVELIQNDQPIERAPLAGLIETFVPSPDYELMMWQA